MEIVSSIVIEIGKCLVEQTIGHVCYMLHLERNFEDLKTQKDELRSKQQQVQDNVEGAKRNAEEIKEEVQQWLTNVSKVMDDVRKLEEDIQLNRTCLNGWCPNWSWRYRLSKEATKKKDKMVKLQEKSFDRVSCLATLPEIISSKDFMPFKTTNSSFDQIMKELRDAKNYVIGLYGIGGVGKTTLAKEVGKKAKEEGLVNVVAIAVVSQTPDSTKIQDQIAVFLGLKLDGVGEAERARRLYSRLKEEKILVILDDVWNTFDLTAIGIPYGDGDDHKGCKILLTTRRLHVCNSMESKNIQLGALSKMEAWALFQKSAALDDNSPTLNDVAMEVAGECKGLPLAITAVGSALKGKTLEEYKLALNQLKTSKLPDIEDVDKDVYASLQLSYDYLKGEKTKLCFLLCSLFPEDYEIDIEDLVRYGMGLDLFQDMNSIEDHRIQLHAIIRILKGASLLLEAHNQNFVKMHDVVRDVALWIASKGENVFMVRAGVGLTEWPKEERFERYTAISLMANKIKVLPSKLECPRLKILLLGGDSVTISDAFFEEMKALKVLSIYKGILSQQSLQFLTNLRTLRLERCNLNDISSLGKLKKLEILRLYDSTIVELPNEIGELNNLILLELNWCRKLKRIPPNVISKLCKLEELYIQVSPDMNWDVKALDVERSDASLWELNSLSHLAVLSLRFDAKDLPVGFVFPKLQMYKIDMRREMSSSNRYYPIPTSRTLILKDINATSLNAFKELFPTVEYLDLVSAAGFQNIIPNMDQGGLNDLISLRLKFCNEMECLIDSTQQHVPTTAFSKLVNLSLEGMTHLREIWPTQHISLQSLRDVEVRNCNRLTYLFSSSHARRLVQLQRLKIDQCEGLEQILIIGKEDGEISDGNDIVLPELREIKLRKLSCLTSFSESNFHWMWPSLQQLTVTECPKLTISFITDLEAKLQALEKQLRILWIGNYSLLHTIVFLLLRQGLQNLKELTIENCEGVQEVFQDKLSASNLKQLRMLRIGNHIQLHKGIVLLQNLERLLIENCEGVKEVFHGISSVSNLKKLELKELTELRVIWKGPTQISNFQNLSEIRVNNCNKLTRIFSPSVARNLPRLEYLYIEGCEELKGIIDEEDKDEEDQIIPFPNLKDIYVRDCNKLKSLFPITIAQGLPQLNYLSVRKASQLEEVFSHENEEDVRDEKKIKLTQLDSLYLIELPRLISICQGDYHFIFPSLFQLEVKDCPKKTTSFTIASDGKTVHAKDKAKAEKSYVVDESDEDKNIDGAEVKVEEEEEEVENDEIIESDIKLQGEIEEPDNAPPQKTPQSVTEDLQEGFSTNQATVATTPSDSNIIWLRHFPRHTTLPPYIEELSTNL